MIDRYEWLSRLAQGIPEDSLVMSTMVGAVGFEWAALTNEHPRTCMLGLMGDVIGLALGLALALPHRKVVCLDADGSVLLELGQLVTLGQEAPKNLVVFVADNGVYESIGTTKGARPRPTATARGTDLAALALACGVPYAKNVHTMDEFERELVSAFSELGCRFINVRTKIGHSKVPPRQIDSTEDKYRFVRHVEQLEKIQIMTRQVQDYKLMAQRDRPPQG
jgi:thiamine pyrophosphate-dependent acetolactate synthase large subunit-like protein